MSGFCSRDSMIILSATYVSAPLSTLLSQGVIPISMLLSYKLLHRRFQREHLLGALVITGGIGFCLNNTR
jgi:drug/metabolite transporter (DMT)-like permease